MIGKFNLLNLSASDIDESNMKSDLLTQLKEKINMNKGTYGAFVKRKWYITVRPKRNQVVEDDDMFIPDLFS